MNKYWLMPALVGAAIIIQAPVLADSPRSTADQFYNWYFSHQRNPRTLIHQQKNNFDPAFYQQLVTAFQKQPSDGDWLDFDPFFNNQMGGQSYSIRSVRLINPTTAQVTVAIVARRGSTAQPVTLVLNKQRSRWRISNVVYPEGPDLLTQLTKINQNTRKP